MPAAPRASHRSAQKSSIFRCYSQVKGHSTARVLTGSPVDDSSSVSSARFMFCGRLHHVFLPSTAWRHLSSCPSASLDVEGSDLFQAMVMPSRTLSYFPEKSAAKSSNLPESGIKFRKQIETANMEAAAFEAVDTRKIPGLPSCAGRRPFSGKAPHLYLARLCPLDRRKEGFLHIDV